MNCWVKDYCNLQPNNCNQYCPAYMLLNAIYSQSNIPKVYQYDKKLIIEAKDSGAYEVVRAYMDNVVEHVEKGRGLYLYGKNTGTGKTSLATRIMNSYFRRKVFESNLECMGVFIECSKFLEDYRASYTTSNKDFEELLYNVFNAPIVVFDDIGVEKVSEWVINRLYDIINHRVSNGLCNIFTSNKDLEQIEDTLGRRIASRIKRCTEQVQFIGKDKGGMMK